MQKSHQPADRIFPIFLRHILLFYLIVHAMFADPLGCKIANLISVTSWKEGFKEKFALFHSGF